MVLVVIHVILYLMLIETVCVLYPENLSKYEGDHKNFYTHLSELEIGKESELIKLTFCVQTLRQTT